MAFLWCDNYYVKKTIISIKLTVESYVWELYFFLTLSSK